LNAPEVWRGHRHVARKQWQAIEYNLPCASTTLAYLRARLASSTTPALAPWVATVRHYEPLIESVIAQSERQVLDGEAVPAREKLVRLFETHAPNPLGSACRCLEP